MKLKKMLRMLKEATEKKSQLYSPAELDYMNHQLQVIEGEIERIEHRDYKGFGKK
jgi:septation ring formation regulator EzrA